MQKADKMKNRLKVSILIMGFSGLVAQMILLRELLIVFSGNELSIGIILANWLILEAFGSFFVGKKAEKIKNKIEIFVVVTIIFSLSLFGSVYFTRILKNILGISIGQSVGIFPILFWSLLILLPTSITHGALFTFGCRIYSLFGSKDASSVGKVYTYETVGMLVGGIIWTYLFIPYLDAFYMSAVLALLNFFICVVLLIPYWSSGKLQKTVATVCFLFFSFSIFFIHGGGPGKLHQLSLEAQWRAQNIVWYQNSIYGNISVTESGGQYTFFSDGVPHVITPVPDLAFVEEFVHLPLLSHPRPEKVMVLTGGAGGMINEILKHPSVGKVEYAELDPLMLELIRKFPTDLTENELTDSRVLVRHTDGRLLLKSSDSIYDVIFIGLSGPLDLQRNRFFTKEFFSLAEKRLGDSGIVVFGLPGSLTHLNEELRDLNATVFNTAKSVFSYVRPMPGEGTNIFLASNAEDIFLIDTEVVIERLEGRGIEAEIIIPRNIDYKLHRGWLDWFLEFLQGGTEKINRDFKPWGVFYSVVHWNAVFAPHLIGVFRWFENLTLRMLTLLFIVFIVLAIIISKRKQNAFGTGVPLCVATTGFAGMMLDLVLIFTFQVIYGYVFSWIGLLVSFFMVGAAAGATKVISILPKIKNDRKFFIRIDLAIIGFSFMLPFVFFIMLRYLDSPAFFFSLKIIFLILSLISGFLVGAQFPLANQMYLKGNDDLSRTAGLIYGADLLGGWIGGILGSIILFPVLGIQGSCIVIVLLKLTSLTVLIFRSDKLPKKEAARLVRK